MSILERIFYSQTKKKPVHIRLWEYGEQIGLDGTTLVDIISWAAREKISSIEGSKFTTTNLIQTHVAHYFMAVGGTVDKSGQELLVLKAEYLLKLEDFRQLEGEKKLTRAANWTAVIAVIVAALSLLANIVVSIYQINSPIRISQDQLEIITNKPIKLDSEQLKTIKDWIEQRKPETEKKNQPMKIKLIKNSPSSIRGI